MRFVRVFITSVLLAGGLAIACSDGGSSQGGGGTSAGFIDQYCSFIGRCCGQSGYPSDGATCRTLAGQASTGREYDPAKGEECLAALRAESSSNPNFCSSTSGSGSGSSTSACGQVYKRTGGGAAPGAMCEGDGDCASSPEGEVDCVSSFSNGATTKTCQVRVRGKEGDSCSGTKDGSSTLTFNSSSDRDGGTPAKLTICDTADNLYCDGTKDICTRIGDIGGSCESLTPHACVKPAYCDSAQKKCIARLAAGAACSAVTARDGCIEDHYCDQETKKCTPSIADGAACQKSEQCKSRSCTNGKCRAGLAELGLTLLCGPKPGG